jgi:hypothetical protein
MDSEMRRDTTAGAYRHDGGSRSEHESQQRHDGGGGKLQEELGSLAETAKAHAAGAIDPMKEKARNIASEQKNVFAERMSAFAGTIDKAADQVAAESPFAGDMLHAAADSLKNTSAALREKRIDELTGALNEFARSQPTALFAGAVIAGFAVSRFLKSSSPEHSGPTSRQWEHLP